MTDKKIVFSPIPRQRVHRHLLQTCLLANISYLAILLQIFSVGDASEVIFLGIILGFVVLVIFIFVWCLGIKLFICLEKKRKRSALTYVLVGGCAGILPATLNFFVWKTWGGVNSFLDIIFIAALCALFFWSGCIRPHIKNA